MGMRVNYQDMILDASFERYAITGNTAIRLTRHADDPAVKSGRGFVGEPIATATVSTHWPMQRTEVAVKGFDVASGGAGEQAVDLRLIDALVAAGVVETPRVHLDVRNGPRRVFDPRRAGLYAGVCTLTRQAQCLVYGVRDRLAA